MKLWEKDIIEWINCSQLLQEPVKNTTELQDGVFYINFLKLIKWEKYENNSNQEDLILKFLEDEYPCFKVNRDDNTEHLYIASLLLVHLSRAITAIHELYNTSSLKYNMFDVLKHETQIRVKSFLENVLPLGKEITKETIIEVIMEVEDTSCTQTTPVAGFSHSPATCSARSKKIMTERIRELRELKSNLAVERFTNTDLREDIKMLQEKIQKLQKKLDEKSEQVKTLRQEQIKQNTPKPSRSKEDISREDYYKKYINDLTSQLNKQQDEIDKLEEKNDTLSKELSSLQRTSLHYKENFAISERSLETLASKLVLKDIELVELRIHNEELRTYIKELNKSSTVEQSFEVEDVPLSMISQRRSLNTSEALSSVIEIQLQEAKEESAILNAQVDTLKGRLNILTKDYKTAIESNRELQEKVKMLDQVQAKLNNTQKELDILNTDITNLQSEKITFIAQNEDLKNLLSSNEKKLSEKEQSIATLYTELDNLKLEVTDLHELLENERINCTNLNISLTETKSQVAEHLTHINKLTDERNSYRSSIENYSKNIRDIFRCDQFIQISIDNLDNLTLDDLIKHLEIMLHNYNTVCTSYKCDIEKLKAAVEETNKNLLEQRLTITTLEERNKQNLEEIRDEKHILEQNLLEVISNLRSNLLNKEQLLKSVMTRLKDIQDVSEDLKSIKEMTQRNFAEYQENVQLIFEKLQRNYQTLHHEFHQVQQEKEEWECNFNLINSELSDIQTRNAIVEENLLENQKIISALKEREKNLCNELNECKQDVLQVRKTNQALEEQYAMMKTEANNNLESLKSENAKISHELEDVTDNFNLLQRKMNDTNKQVELKQTEINKLRLDVSFLREEKESLIYSHKEQLDTKDKEINMKEDAIITLEKTLKDMTSESSSIIKQLQEVRTSQFAMIASQEEALDRLKLENDEISLELKNTTDNLNLLQEKMNDTNAQIELKQKEINKLHLDAALLREEKENLICVHKEELDAKDKEVEAKEEAIVTLQIKMDKMANETSSIIKDLQKVKTSQDTMIASQEEALDRLKLENDEISLELKNATDNLNLLQEKMNDTNTQIELKEKEINKLHLDAALLKEEKENLICVHKEELDAKDKEIEVKEEAIVTLQIKMDKMANETSSIIKDLQKVKTSQDTMIASQEEALDRLKLENDEISLELKNATDNLNLLQEKMNDTNTQIELKQKEINKLHLDAALLKEEKGNLICVHKEELDAKDKEIEVKEETIVTLQIKMDKMTNETSFIIKDLQKVKTSQDTMIASQEEALDRLKLENDEISLELKNATDNLNLLQKKMNDTNTQMELKQKEISDLHLDISLLRKEKESLICMHKEELDAKDKEINIKEEAITILEMRMKDMASESSSITKELEELRTSQFALIASRDADVERLKSENAELLQKVKDDSELQIEQLRSHISSLKLDKEHLIQSYKEALEEKDKELGIKEEALTALQAKMDKLENKACVTEKKLKEIIVNLQEVRSSQDAVLTTQEAALKEKCLHIEELQEEFASSKEILNKELENAKLSLLECQSNLLDVQNQINDKNKTIADQTTALAELREMLKEINAELETNKEHCKFMDASRAKIVKLCEELEQPTKNLNSTIMEMCSSFDFLDQNLQDVSQYENIYIDNETANILNIIKMTIDQLHKSQRVISHLSCANAESNKLLEEQNILLENSAKDKEEICGLKNKIQELEVIAEKRNDYLKNLIKSKESLKESLQKVFASRNDLDNILTSSKQKWDEILTKFQGILHIEGLVCDEFKQLQDKKTSLANALFKCEIDSLENVKTISDILWKNFLWTEQKLRDTYLCSVHEKECLDVLTNAEEDQFSDEKMIIHVQLEKQEALRTDVIKSEEEIDSFTNLATCYENNLKSGKIKNQTEAEKKLQNQISQLTKEGKDLKNKMDSMRSRNVKLEKNIDDLRAEIKKLKSTETESIEVNMKEIESLKEKLKQQNQLHEENLLQLHKEKDESIKIAKQKLESQLKEVHTSYERKLEDVKQKMKTAYNEQMSKLNKEQEKIIREKLQSQMEAMCQKQREELNRYKSHVSDLSSQLWTIGEKLIIEQKHHEDAVQRCRELQTKLKEVEADQAVATISRKTCTMAKQEMLPPESTQQRAQKVTTLITEETIERRHSIRNMQAMGNMFKTEDEDEIFDNVYLADMKRGNCLPSTDNDRLSILQMRNSLCRPHLKSSYPAEMQFLPSTLTEEEIKSGSPAEETFNDSLSQSLLPEQKARKKDRSQTSYKKPGPPTPSKNGGRLSLQGNELKSPSSRILRERNADRRVTTTPHSLKNIFSLKRQDENASSTPKGRRLSSLFRKSRMQSDR